MAGNFRELLRLWSKYASMDLLRLMRSRRTALIVISSDVVLNVAVVSTSLLLAQRFNGIGRWDKYQIFFMLGYAMTVNGLLNIFFGYNLRMISRRIGRGQLDHMLLQPPPFWRTFITEGFIPFSEPSVLVIAGAFMGWSAGRMPAEISAVWIVALIINLLASACVLLSFQISWGAIAFWAPMSAEEINSSTNRMVASLGTLPLDAVTIGLRGVLVTVVPVGLTAWLPARELAGPGEVGLGALATPLAAPVFALLALLIFRKGLAHYAEIGSQRYLAFGHRR